MAKVYSWEISNTKPKKYAYIVDPKNENNILISYNELDGSDLDSVRRWAAMCSDEDYINHFNLIVEKCPGVAFEDVSAYLNIKTSCDNLRGPAGRGIEYVSGPETDGIVNTYTIHFDDGNITTFKVLNGEAGPAGRDGKDGAPGDKGVSSKLAVIYKSNKSENGDLIPIGTPIGGKYNFDTNTLTLPTYELFGRDDKQNATGWVADNSGLIPPIYMSQKIFTSTETSDAGLWSTPIIITGENGAPGADGISSEFIYMLITNEPSVVELPSENERGFVPKEYGWTGSPSGVDEDHQTEWASVRKYIKEEEKWGEWERAFRWSQYGVNGQDGDGVQYMYLRTMGTVPKNPTPWNYLENNEYQNKDNEWIPSIEPYINHLGQEVKFEDVITDEEGNEVILTWTDEPSGVDMNVQYEWVSSRKYRVPKSNLNTHNVETYAEAIALTTGDNRLQIGEVIFIATKSSYETDGNMVEYEEGLYEVTGVGTIKKIKGKEWTAYSTPTLWAKFGENGKTSVIRKLYCLTEGTNEVPQLPVNSTDTGEWGTGFPKDYRYGENVVWGTEAEIWVRDNTFVGSYKEAIYAGEKPSDADESNTKEYVYIPIEKDADNNIKYILIQKENGKNTYYEWQEGWCEPYLVTGTKGQDAEPVNYNTTVYTLGYEDYMPNIPSDGTETINKDKNVICMATTNLDASIEPVENKSPWLRWPDTVTYGTDGEIINGFKARWYQCQVAVNGTDSKIDKWNDKASILNPKDGESIIGPYQEFRFASIPNNETPQLTNVNDRKNPRYTHTSLNGQEKDWLTTSNNIVSNNDESIWQIYATIDGQTEEFYNNSRWYGPIRVTGERGEQGPAGLRGPTGLPGSNLDVMYCLGTQAPINEDGETEIVDSYEYFWDENKENIELNQKYGYFGSKIKVGEEMLDSELTDWFSINELPNTAIINILDKDIIGKDIIEIIKSGEYKNGDETVNIKGRVLRHIRDNASDGTQSFNGQQIKVYDFYYVLKTPLTNENDDTEYYRALRTGLTDYDGLTIAIWCIQGSKVYQSTDLEKYIEVSGKPSDANRGNTWTVNTVQDIPTKKQVLYKYIYCSENDTYYEWKEVSGSNILYNSNSHKWGSPFRLQGVNGLRGFAGNRGQVVYPMGIYNQEEVYITTKDKAPYVYDPNDGQFYVYNIVGMPWVGKMPNDYQNVLEHPADATSDNTCIADGIYNEEDINKKTDLPSCDKKYVRFLIKRDGYEKNGLPYYYTWNEKDEKYVNCSKHKYSFDGVWGNWISADQEGTTPSDNYANNTNDNKEPAWVKFESYQALFTNIGIIANGMIGSAVYNNEFMFSQQGIDENGNPSTNYQGFLSGYKYNETGEIGADGILTGKHWYHSTDEKYISDREVNPYESIHNFRPNVCINFSTGQMWTSCGKAFFDTDGTGHLADKAIKWGYDSNRNIAIQIGGPLDEFGYGQGIQYANEQLTIGTFKDFENNQQDAYNDLIEKINKAIEGFQQQVDNKIETHYQDNDPSENWMTDADKEKHVGDMWLYSGIVDKDFDGQTIKIGTTYVYTKKGENKYQWVEQKVPQEVFDKIDGKANIFTFTDGSDENPTNYHKGDLWILQRDVFPSFGFKKGVVLIAIVDMNEDYGYNINDWETQLSYTDDTSANLALTQIANIADDGYVSPGEMMALKQQKENIKTAYNVINEQLQIINATDDISSWQVCYLAAIGAINYHTDKNNAVSDPTSEYYNCIPINKDSFAKIEDFFTKKTELEKKYFTTTDEITAKKDDFAKNIGYADYADMVKQAEEEKQTIIKNGHINTSLIEADAVITNAISAQDAWIDKLTVKKLEAENTNPGGSGTKMTVNSDKLEYVNTSYNGGKKSYVIIRNENITPIAITYTKSDYNTINVSAGGTICDLYSLSRGQEIATIEIENVPYGAIISGKLTIQTGPVTHTNGKIALRQTLSTKCNQVLTATEKPGIKISYKWLNRGFSGSKTISYKEANDSSNPAVGMFWKMDLPKYESTYEGGTDKLTLTLTIAGDKAQYPTGGNPGDGAWLIGVPETGYYSGTIDTSFTPNISYSNNVTTLGNNGISITGSNKNISINDNACIIMYGAYGIKIDSGGISTTNSAGSNWPNLQTTYATKSSVDSEVKYIKTNYALNSNIEAAGYVKNDDFETKLKSFKVSNLSDGSNYPTSATISSTYATKSALTSVEAKIPTDYVKNSALGSYALKSDLNGYAKKIDIPSLNGYVTLTDLENWQKGADVVIPESISPKNVIMYGVKNISSPSAITVNSVGYDNGTYTFRIDDASSYQKILLISLTGSIVQSSLTMSKTIKPLIGDNFLLIDGLYMPVCEIPQSQFSTGRQIRCNVISGSKTEEKVITFKIS